MSLLTVPTIVVTADRDVDISAGTLAEIAHGVRRQVHLDLAPVWGVTAHITSAAPGAAIPAGQWKCVIKNQLDEPGALGYHLDDHNKPEALVQLGGSLDDTSVTVSHEVLEMLVDPSGNFTVPGVVNGKRAEVLVEVADPPEAYAYHHLGVAVSDFLLPRYYGPQDWANPGIKDPARRPDRLTHLDKVLEPFTVAEGGYLSYENVASGEWEQVTWFEGSTPRTTVLGRYDTEQQRDWRSLRAFVDHHTGEARRHLGSLR